MIMDNPCTPDCPDRPNCKGCVRGNRYRNAKIKEYAQQDAERNFKQYEIDMFNRKFNRSVEKRKSHKRMVHRK